MVDLALPLVALCALASLGLGLMLSGSRARRVTLLVIPLFLMLTPQMQLPLPGDGRVLALPLLMGLASGYRGGPISNRWGLVPLWALAAWLTLSAIWSPGEPSYIGTQVLFGLGLASVVFIALRKLADVRAALAIVGMLVVALCIFYLLALPSDARLGGRFRGPLSNPNTLAAILPLLLPAMVATWRRLAIPLWVVGAVIIWQTGSRAGLLALIVQVLLWAWGRLPLAGRVGMALTTAVAAYLWLPGVLRRIASGGAGDSSVLRGNNSRDSVWAHSQELVDLHPLRGSGLASYTSDFETGSSIYAVWIQAGAIGLVLVAVTIALAFLRVRSTSDWRFWALAGGVVDAAFEGWLMAPGTLPAIAFWACLTSCLGIRREHANDKSERNDSFSSVSSRNASRGSRSVRKRALGVRETQCEHARHYIYQRLWSKGTIPPHGATPIYYVE